jgi:hypothetical protein
VELSELIPALSMVVTITAPIAIAAWVYTVAEQHPALRHLRVVAGALALHLAVQYYWTLGDTMLALLDAGWSGPRLPRRLLTSTMQLGSAVAVCMGAVGISLTVYAVARARRPTP